MNTPDPDDIVWHKSSYSATNNGCVEVGHSVGDMLVRDSKARRGPVLAFPATPWRAFLTTVTDPSR